MMKVLIINNVVPDPEGPGADLRLTLLMRSFIASGHRLTLIAMRPSASPHVADVWKRLGVSVCQEVRDQSQCCIYPDERTVATVSLKADKYDLAIIALWFWEGLSAPEVYLNLLWRLSPRTVTAILTDDSHGRRQLQIASIDPSLIEIECSFDLKTRETEAYRNCDLVIALSEPERRNVLALQPSCKCFIIPLVLERQSTTVRFEDREGLCFLGNFRNHATKTTLDLLLQEVLPLIRSKLGNVKLSVAGLHSEELTLSNVPNVSIRGRIDNLQAFFDEHRVFVCPTSYGTGITTKVALAMSYGLPTITTPSGLQSMSPGSRSDLVVNNTMYQVAISTIKVYSDRDTWETLSENGLTSAAKLGPTQDKLLLGELLSWVSERKISTRGELAEWSTIEALKAGLQSGEPATVLNLPSLFLNAARMSLNAGQAEKALVSLRHAICVSKSWFKKDPNAALMYRAILRCLLEAYQAVNDELGVRRVLDEQHWYNQLLALKDSDFLSGTAAAPKKRPR